ncbi:nucleotidyltransferase domain-containing protein [Candidatus Kaiserbacteria bacterium]|nr:nucleotidyltransferase domain-containing protein [Candidatus Kaiserbacteria bacterium]
MAQNTITIDQDVLQSAARFRSVVESSGIPVQKMILFGSYAKGLANPRSDIDLAVVSPQFGHDDVEEMQTLWKKTRFADIRIEPYPLSPEDLEQSNSPVIEEIRAHGIVV